MKTFMQSGDKTEVNLVLADLSEGMRVEVYNASGTLRYRIEITVPSFIKIDELPREGSGVTQE